VEFKKVISKSDLTPGTGKTVQMNGSEIAIFNVDNNFYAIDNTCLHRGGPLGDGDLSGKNVSCPLHGWEYDITTGATVADPSVKVKIYEVKVEGEDVLVAV